MAAVRETIIDITDPELRGMLREFGSPVKAAPWTVGRGDSGPRRFRFVEPTGSDRRQFKDANTTDYGIEVAVGNLDAAPTAGTWWLGVSTATSGTLTTGRRYYIQDFNAGDSFTNVGAASNATGIIFTASGTTPTTWSNGSTLWEITANLDFDATAGEVQTALNATAAIGASGVAVTLTGTNYFEVVWASYGNKSALNSFAQDLSPECGVYVTSFDGDTDTFEVQTIRLLQAPIAYQNAFAAYPVGAATVEVLVAGDATHKELVRISLDEPAYDGAMIVTLGTSKKFSIACVTNAANALNSTGFIMSDTAGTVGVWYNVAAAGTAPAAILACDRQIEITTVGATDNRATVASKSATAINADAAFTATSNGGAVKVTLDAAGDVDDPADVNTTFTFTSIQEGTSISASVPVNSGPRDFAAALGNVVNVAKSGNWQWDLTFRTVGNQSDIDVDASALFPSGYEGDLNFITRQCFRLFASDPTAASFSPYLEISLTPPGEGSFTVYHAPITLLRDVIVNEVSGSAPIPSTFSIETGKLVYVDTVFGNDASAARQRFDRRYLTGQAGVNGANSGDTVVLGPGTHTGDIILKDGVALMGMPGHLINGKLYDNGVNVSCRLDGLRVSHTAVALAISGLGSITVRNSEFVSSGDEACTLAVADLDATGCRFETTDGTADAILKTSGTLLLRNCGMYGVGGDSIGASTPQNVMAAGCVVNRDVDANITNTVAGGILFDADAS